MKEHVYLWRRNSEIRRLRLEKRMSAKEVVATIRQEWPEVNLWVVYRVARVSPGTKTPKDANRKNGKNRSLAVE